MEIGKLLISYDAPTDLQMRNDGHTYLGVAYDKNDGEIHIFLDKQSELPKSCDCDSCESFHLCHI